MSTYVIKVCKKCKTPYQLLRICKVINYPNKKRMTWGVCEDCHEKTPTNELGEIPDQG